MKKILNNLRTWLIHRLGGLTVEESQESDYNSYDMGYLFACIEHKAYAESLYGISSEEWCKKMYERLEYDSGLPNKK